MMKRFTSIFLTFLLLISLFSVFGCKVYAEDEEGNEVSSEVIETEDTEGQEEAPAPTEEELPEALPEEEEALASEKAYAVLTDSGELIFFNSTETYEAGAGQTVSDVDGNEYTGEVFTGIQTSTSPFKGNTAIRSVRVANGQKVMLSTGHQYFMGCTNLVETDQC